jgi:hypothetical protein
MVEDFISHPREIASDLWFLNGKRKTEAEAIRRRHDKSYATNRAPSFTPQSNNPERNVNNFGEDFQESHTDLGGGVPFEAGTRRVAAWSSSPGRCLRLGEWLGLRPVGQSRPFGVRRFIAAFRGTVRTAALQKGDYRSPSTWCWFSRRSFCADSSTAAHFDRISTT